MEREVGKEEGREEEKEEIMRTNMAHQAPPKSRTCYKRRREEKPRRSKGEEETTRLVDYESEDWSGTRSGTRRECSTLQ